MARLFQDQSRGHCQHARTLVRLQFTMKDLGYQFPSIRCPAAAKMASFLRERTDAGARDRFPSLRRKITPAVERELALIEKAWARGLLPSLSGTSSSSVFRTTSSCRPRLRRQQRRLLCIGITAVDPVKMGLLFERFLSEERGEWPDIDMDLPSGDQRERAIQYIYQRYGALGAAMTANVITYRGRSAAREVGKSARPSI